MTHSPSPTVTVPSLSLTHRIKNKREVSSPRHRGVFFSLQTAMDLRSPLASGPHTMQEQWPGFIAAVFTGRGHANSLPSLFPKRPHSEVQCHQELEQASSMSR